MKLLVFILNKAHLLDELLKEFALHGICGATILDSEGMARVLSNKKNLENEIPFLGSLRTFLNPERQKSHTILTVIQEDQLNEAVSVIESVVGDLSGEDTGIAFSLPLDFVKGLYGCGKYNNY